MERWLKAGAENRRGGNYVVGSSRNYVLNIQRFTFQAPHCPRGWKAPLTGRLESLPYAHTCVSLLVISCSESGIHPVEAAKMQGAQVRPSVDARLTA